MELKSQITETIVKFFKNSTTIKDLNISGSRLGAEIKPIFDALKTNRTLEKLDVGNNSIDDDGCTALVELLLHNTTLKEVVLTHNPIGQAGIQILADTFKVTNSTCKTLVLNMIQNYSTLEKLDLGWKDFDDIVLTALMVALKRNKALAEVTVGSNKIQEELFIRNFDVESVCNGIYCYLLTI